MAAAFPPFHYASAAIWCVSKIISFFPKQHSFLRHVEAKRDIPMQADKPLQSGRFLSSTLLRTCFVLLVEMT
jgi:hypothetical protein